MRPADLLNRLQDDPFKPFRIHLSDGTAIDVPDRNMVIVGNSSVVLPSQYGEDDEGHRIARSWRTVALIHMVQFSDLDEPSNGRGRTNARRRKK